MFKCQKCQKNGIRVNRLVTHVRPVTYQLRLKIIRTKVNQDTYVPQEEISYRELKRTQGTEIARELQLCSKCFGGLKEQKPKIVGSERREVIVKTLINPREFNKDRKQQRFNSKKPNDRPRKGEANSGKSR